MDVEELETSGESVSSYIFIHSHDDLLLPTFAFHPNATVADIVVVVAKIFAVVVAIVAVVVTLTQQAFRACS